MIRDASIAIAVPAERPLRRWRVRQNTLWGSLCLLPYGLVFVCLVIYPLGLALVLGSDPASYKRLFADPIYLRTVVNTAIFLLVGVNLTMVAALFVSGLFVMRRPWMGLLAFLFMLPWAIPSLPTILSIRWMLNSEWGMINAVIFRLTGADGPNWLLDPTYAFGAVILTHVWKSLPFWTVILIAARLAIPPELYEAAAVDGAGPWGQFRSITLPSVSGIYVVGTALSTVWSLGDFNSVFLLTGGGPYDTTNTLATLGFRYAFQMADVKTGVATVMTAMPLVLLIMGFIVHRLGRAAA